MSDAPSHRVWPNPTGWRLLHRTGMVNQWAEFLLWLGQTGGRR